MSWEKLKRLFNRKEDKKKMGKLELKDGKIVQAGSNAEKVSAATSEEKEKKEDNVSMQDVRKIVDEVSSPQNDNASKDMEEYMRYKKMMKEQEMIRQYKEMQEKKQQQENITPIKFYLNNDVIEIGVRAEHLAQFIEDIKVNIYKREIINIDNRYINCATITSFVVG